MLIYTNQGSQKKKKKRHKGSSKKFETAKAEHTKFLKKFGVKPSKRNVKGCSANFSDLTVHSEAANMSNNIPANGIRNDLDDYKWKKDRTENADAIKEAEKKKSRIAPAFNKGPVMYVTDDADLWSLGRKV